MKILAIADIHGDTGLVKRIGKLADKENVDIIAIAGDLTWFGKDTGKLISPMLKNNRDILLIHGNHEDETLIQHFSEIYPNTFNLHKKHHIKKNIGFFGSGTTDWGFKEDGEQVFKELEHAHKKIKHLKKKIMMPHCPPVGSAIEQMGFPGSYGTLEAIKKFKPNLVICGHIHEGGGLIEKIGGAKVINAAKTPIIIEI